MNDQQFNKLKQTILANDLRDELDNFFGKPTTNKNDHRQLRQSFAYAIKQWLQWKTFLLIITVGWYALYYYVKQEQNIFSGIKNAKAKRVDFLDLKTDFAPKLDKEKELLDDLDPERFKPKSIEEKLLHHTQLRFEENIRICHPLKDGNFVVQGFDNHVRIIDEVGNHIRDLKTLKKVRRTNHDGYKSIHLPTEITAFSQLENGNIVGAGHLINSAKKTCVVFCWSKSNVFSSKFKGWDRVIALDTIDNQIALALRKADVGRPTYKLATFQNYKAQTSKNIWENALALMEHPGIVKFSTIHDEITYAEQHNGNNQKIHVRKALNGEKILILDKNVDLIHRISDNHLITAKRNTLTFWDQSFNELGENKHNLHQSQIIHIVSSPNYDYFATSDVEGVIGIWSSISGELIDQLNTEQNIQQLFIDNDGTISAAIRAPEHDLLENDSLISHINFYRGEKFEPIPSTNEKPEDESDFQFEATF